MQPFVVRASDATVEVWSGFRVQFGGAELPAYHALVKAELKKALLRLAIPVGAPLAGYYDTSDPRSVDTENSLFTNLPESMPRGVTSLRFERGVATPPAPPVPIDLIRGHLHYYRYQVGGHWSAWEADKTLARWSRRPRRLSANDSARPVWFALRDAHAHGQVVYGATVSKDTISKITDKVIEEMTEWCNRPLESGRFLVIVANLGRIGFRCRDTRRTRCPPALIAATSN